MSVVLLCHFNGTNGSTAFTDTWGGHTLTSFGGAVVNTAAPKFGTGAGDFTASGTAFIGTGNAVDFELGGGAIHD